MLDLNTVAWNAVIISAPVSGAFGTESASPNSLPAFDLTIEPCTVGAAPSSVGLCVCSWIPRLSGPRNTLTVRSSITTPPSPSTVASPAPM